MLKPLLLLTLLMAVSGIALANPGVSTATFPIPQAPLLPSVKSYVLIDYDSGQVIAAKNDDLELPPASLTKLMTAYLTYQAVQNGIVHIDEQVSVSKAAWKAGGSSMFIQPRLPVTVGQLLQGLLIDSGNDAAVALAQTVAGNQSSFVSLMNETARRLGLKNTYYSDVDGLPDPTLHASALDVGLLSRALIKDYPQILKITDEKYFTYNHITQRSWNPVIFRDPTVDGLKTGLTKQSGHCIDATAVRGGRRLIAVVMNGPSWNGSTGAVEALLDYGYHFSSDHTVYRAGQQVEEISQTGLSPMRVPIGVGGQVTITIPKGHYSLVRVQLLINPQSHDNITKGEVVGQIVLSENGSVIKTVPAVALRSAVKASFFGELVNKLRQYV